MTPLYRCHTCAISLTFDLVACLITPVCPVCLAPIDDIILRLARRFDLQHASHTHLEKLTKVSHRTTL